MAIFSQCADQGKDTYAMTSLLWNLRYLALEGILQTDLKAGS